MQTQRAQERQLIEECRLLLSHEMRSPLMVIEGFAQQLLDRHAAQIDEKGAHYLHRMLGATRHLSAQVEGMLTMIEASRQPMHIMRVDVTAMCRSLCEEMRAADPQREVQVEIEEGMSCEADSTLLRLVFSQIIANAFKFTARTESARIAITTEPQRDEAESRTFCVSDNGAGFDPALSRKLFQAFSKLHPVSEFAGLGLGLAIARHAVERHDGQLWAEGTPQQGCCFRLALPQ